MPRFVKLTLAAVVSAIALVGASLVVALFVLDGEDYVELAAPVLEDALGWRLEVGGPVSVDRSLSFAVTGQNAVLQRGQTRLAAAKQVIFRLELPALLRGRFQFSVDVQDPDVQFTIDQAGKTNWNFEQFAEEGGGFPLEVVIAGIRAAKGKALLREEASGTALELDLEEFVFREVADQYEFAFDFVSAYEGHDFRAKGRGRVDDAFETLSPEVVIDLLQGTNKHSSAASLDRSTTTRSRSRSDDESQLAGVEARLGAENPQLAVTGSLKQLPDDPVAHLEARVAARDLAQLSSLLGIALPAVGPLHVVGEVELRRGSYQLTGLQASLGQSDLAGRMALHTNEARPRLVADLSAERLQLDDILITQGSSTAQEKKASQTDRPDRVFSDDPIPLGWLKAFDGQIRVQAKHLVLYRLFHDVRFTVNVDKGTLELSQALGLGDGSSDTRLRIDARRSPPSFALSDTARGVPLSFVLGLPEGIILGGKVDGQAQIEGRGGTPRALAASLNGKILYEMGEAKLVEAGLKTVSADLLSGILNSLSPTSTDKGDASEGGFTHYRCGVFGIKIEEGILRGDQSIALESEKFNIGGDGYVDLKKETIDLAIRPMAKTGLGLSIGTLLGGFSVGGTLSSPNVQLNSAGVAVTATIGVAVHLLKDWVTVNDFSCTNTLKRIRKQQGTDLEKSSSP
jgi:hypothetical protein